MIGLDNGASGWGITLVTGIPGSGKTLYTLYQVEQLRKKEGREVYYFNIQIDRDKLPWIELDEQQVLKWFDLPPRSIVVIDECQRIFRPRPAGSAVPEAEMQLETHRHKGIDLFLITQHPSLVSVGVRRLVRDHLHIMRVFGAPVANVYAWKGVKEQCDKSRADAIKSTFKYPKEVYGWYKSAEVHTVKFRLPWKIVLAAFFVLLMVVLVFLFYRSFQVKPAQDVALPGQSVSPLSETYSKNKEVSAVDKHKPEAMTEYYSAETPRISDMPWTAPKYDQLTKPSVAPVFEGCIIFSSEAWCYLQGGIKRKVEMQFAKNFIENHRPFIDFQSTPDRGQLGVSAGTTKPLISHDS